MTTKRDIKRNRIEHGVGRANSQRGPTMKKSTISLASIFLLASTLAAGTAQAGDFDGLRCFKVKERTRAFRATANLSTMDDESTLAVAPGCQITGRVARYCTPADNSIVTTDSPAPKVSGQELVHDYTCYRVKCPANLHSEPNLTDSFGRQFLSRYQAREVCVAAN